MTNFSLYKRLTEIGTLSEPKGNPKPAFALPSTINWMRALAMLASADGRDFNVASRFYEKIAQKSLTDHQLNSVLEHLLFALRQLSSLTALEKIKPQGDVARIAVVSWYYGIYWATKAMIAAYAGQVQDNHTPQQIAGMRNLRCEV